MFLAHWKQAILGYRGPLIALFLGVLAPLWIFGGPRVRVWLPQWARDGFNGSAGRAGAARLAHAPALGGAGRRYSAERLLTPQSRRALPR